MTRALGEASERTLAPPLELSGIVKRWGDTPVLTGGELTLEHGQVAWIGGRNGAGKTTLLRIAAGLIVADAGEVYLQGLHPERDRREYQRRLGYLAAGNGGLYARLTVRQNLEFWSCIAFVPQAERRQAVDTAIIEFELDELAGRRVDRMSMGQRQRVRLAMAFLHRPTLVLLDEPHTSLDDDGTALLRRALERLRDAGGAAIWCSPSADQADIGFDVAHVIDDGRLRAA